MERSERLFEMLGEIDPDLIAAVKISPPAKRPAVWKKWLSAVACLCLCAVIGTVAMQIQMSSEDMKDAEITSAASNKYPPAESVSSGQNSTQNNLEGAFPIQTTGGKYDHFTAGKITYTVAYSHGKISSVLLCEKLGHAKAENISSSNNTTLPITYYRLRGIDISLAVGVIFEGEEDIYVYSNEDYLPETLGDLFAAASLEEYLTVGTVTLTRAADEQLTTTVYSADHALTVTNLLSRMIDTAPVRVSDSNVDGISLFPAKRPILLSIQMEMPMFHVEYAYIQITQNGYLILPLLGNYYVFPMDETVLSDYLTALTQKADSRTETEIIPWGNGSWHTGPTTMAAIYRTIKMDDIAYRCYTREYGIAADHVGEALGELKVGIADAAPVVTYYRIHGISPALGIAVRFPGEETFYSYYNRDYRPETLGDLIKDTGLTSYLRPDDPVVCYRNATVTQTGRFMNTDDALLWQYLLTDLTAKNIATEKTFSPDADTVCIEIPLQIPLFSGAKDYTLWITKDGDLWIDLLDIHCVFPISFDETRRAQYLFELLLRYPDCGLKVADSTRTTSTWPAWQWEGAPLHEQFTGLEWRDATYGTTHETVDPDAISRRLGTVDAIGCDPKTRMIYRKTVACYAVADYAERHALAVYFEEEDLYYLYMNRSFSDLTLGDLMKSYDILEKGTLTEFRASVQGVKSGNEPYSGGGYYRSVDIYFPDADPKQAWKTLFSDRQAPGVPVDGMWDFRRYYHYTLRFTLLCPTMDDGEIDMILDRNGYLCFSLENEQCYVYNIGTERTAAFFDYILANCIENHEIRDGAIVIRDGETRLGVITDQLTERFQPKDTAS